MKSLRVCVPRFEVFYICVLSVSIHKSLRVCVLMFIWHTWVIFERSKFSEFAEGLWPKVGDSGICKVMYWVWGLWIHWRSGFQIESLVFGGTCSGCDDAEHSHGMCSKVVVWGIWGFFSRLERCLTSLRVCFLSLLLKLLLVSLSSEREVSRL